MGQTVKVIKIYKQSLGSFFNHANLFKDA